MHTKGDIIRLADTELYIQVEEDRTVYGDECKFGGGKGKCRYNMCERVCNF